MDANQVCEFTGLRPRTVSNASQYTQNFPLMTSDSGLYTCSSNTSDCSLQLESDADSYSQSKKTNDFKDERLQFALQDVCKLRSELERLTKSEQWYKQELKQQKSTRLEDLERIYTQERKFMQENQRLQKECVRLYEKCNEMERDLQKQNQDFHEQHFQNKDYEKNLGQNLLEFEKEQHLALIKDQQQLITVLRKQKRSLLEDLRSLTVEKDEKVNDLQRLLADSEFENKLITKKCSEYAKERLNLENTVKQTENKVSVVQEEKLNLQKSIIDLKEQLGIQQQLLKFKESEIDSIQQHYTNKIQHEQDLDQVHDLSIKYQEEINVKTLEVINLKQRLHEMQDELEEISRLQQQNEDQQKQIDKLSSILEEYSLEIQELKKNEQHKNKQMEELHTTVDQLLKDKEIAHVTTVEQQNELLTLKRALKSTQQQYEEIQELYKSTQFQLELLEVEQGKDKFQNESDKKEIELLRSKLKEYLQQTTELSNKIQFLESELNRVLGENSQLKQDAEQMIMLINNFKQNDEVKESGLSEKLKGDVKTKNVSVDNECQQEFSIHSDTARCFVDDDFLELQYQCQSLQEKLDSIKDNNSFLKSHLCLEKEESLENCLTQQNLNCYINKDVEAENKEKLIFENKGSGNVETDIDFVNLSLQSKQLQENLENLNDFISEKQLLLSSLNIKQASNEGFEKLVKENEILKEKLNAIEAEALTLQIKEDITESSQKYEKMEENLNNHVKKYKTLQKELLENDGKLYKMQRNSKSLEENETELAKLRIENVKLKEQLSHEQANKTELKSKLQHETDKLIDLRQSLEVLKLQKRQTKNQAIQCESSKQLEEENEIVKLKKHVLQLQQEQRHFLEQETQKKEERLQFLQQIMNLQNEKMLNLQKHQRDWEDMLITLNNANTLEEKTRKELELKRMELEELNQVFAEQNEEFRKLEEFTALLNIKKQQEKEQLELTFQQKINVMKKHFHIYQNEIEQQKLVNEQLEKQNDRFKQDIHEEFASETAEYKREIRELKTRVSKLRQEREDLLEQIKEFENQNKELNDKKREAILMPDFSLLEPLDVAVQNSTEHLEVFKQNISEDHLRILTKVLEAEYQRKMLRYDEHIHSLLSNVKNLKKSLRANEEKTLLLSEEQIKTQEELKELQTTKRSLEEMRFKYEQSQNTIKELKDTLAFERKKFELSDLGKSSQNGTAYEVSNLIDDYKKLIQQSALATKRPSSSAILDLIKRSNQYVPNLHKLETNVDGLRADVQTFLASYSHKLPASSLIATASLSVPPSLMDELRAATEGY